MHKFDDVITDESTSTVLDAIAFLLAGHLAKQDEETRCKLLDMLVESTRFNTRRVAGEPQA
jgi:hypothetical protein